MIRINLLKSPSRKTAPKQSSGLLRAVLVSGLLLVIVALLGSGGWWMWAHRSIVTRLAVRKAPAPVQPPAATTDFTPSTYVKPDMVEDVVREVGDDHARSLASGLLDLPYNEMSFAEKINYEVLFARKIVELLGKAVPFEIGLKSLDVDNFQTVYAVGLGQSREQITSTFNTLRHDRVELLPQPYSYVKPNSAGGFRFVFTCKADFGLDLTDPFQATDHLISRDDLTTTLKNIGKFAVEDGIAFHGEPQQVSAEKVGSYIRFVYHVAGQSSYKNFVKFILHLNSEKVPCAFKKISLTAQTESSVDLSADLLLTARE